MVRWEVWVSDDRVTWRFNSCFDDMSRADIEAEWYHHYGYHVEIRGRTTRFQRPEHITTG